MENIENLLCMYEQLRSCTNPDEVETMKKSLKGSIHIKQRQKENDRDLCKNGETKEHEIRNMGKSRMLSIVDKSKKVDNLIKEVKELAKIGKFGVDLTTEVHEEMQVEFPISNLVGEEFERYMKEISDLLTENKASTIGVWGMGGVGKTNLIRHLHNMMLAQHHIYGYVYWITVSKDCSIQKLQIDIAKRIEESISDKLDESQRAGILAKALKRKKKFVLILDDMWSDFDLNEVGLGIPKEIGYRLIITSRSKDVCLKMYCDNIIKVDPLSKRDAWTLFVMSIGHEIPDDLTEISIDVLNECAGLPLGIITLAKSMIGCNDVCEWRNVLDELRISSDKVDDMEEKVFNVLRLSYDRLKDSEIKECLLYCTTYPEDYQIETNELIWLFIDAGLLGKNVGMTKMFDKGLATLRKLERLELLSIEQKFSKDGVYVHLHDLIRDMTLKIAGSRFMIKAGIRLKEIPDEESWTDQLEVVSLVLNEIKDISDSSPNCKRLRVLLLKHNFSLSMICDGFFRHLNMLKYLDLSHSEIKTFPKSISLLKNLSVLILRVCMFLKNVESLEKLTSMERLDLFGTCISQLPECIESLIKLRYLNLWNTRIRNIGVGVIGKLTALQYLEINASIEDKELNSLNNLEHLSVRFENFDSFSTFIEQMKINGKPNSYKFILGSGSSEFIDDSSDYIVPISNQWGEKRIYLTNIFSRTQGDSDMMSLADRHNKLLKILFGNHNTSLEYSLQRSLEIEKRANVFCENDLKKLLQDIHLLDVSNNWYLTCLGDFVIDTVNLQRLFKILGPKPFANLKSLTLSICPYLKKLFPLELLSNLQNIEEISIWSCEGLKELIESATDETELGEIEYPKTFSFPKLRGIDLEELQNLERICSDDKVIRTPSLQWIKIIECPKLKRMPLDVDDEYQIFLVMYKKEEKEMVESLEWDPPHSKSRIRFKESE